MGLRTDGSPFPPSFSSTGTKSVLIKSESFRIIPCDRFEEVPKEESRAIEAALMPYFGIEFNHNMSLEMRRNGGAFPGGTRAQIDRFFLESSAVHTIKRLMKLHKPGPKPESFLPGVEPQVQLFDSMKQTAAEAELRSKETEDLEYILSGTLFDAGSKEEIEVQRISARISPKTHEQTDGLNTQFFVYI